VAPAGPWRPRGPCGPCGPAGSCPRLKSLRNSENGLTLADVTALRFNCAVPTLSAAASPYTPYRATQQKGPTNRDGAAGHKKQVSPTSLSIDRTTSIDAHDGAPRPLFSWPRPWRSMDTPHARTSRPATPTPAEKTERCRSGTGQVRPLSRTGSTKTGFVGSLGTASRARRGLAAPPAGSADDQQGAGARHAAVRRAGT
jgi:hypothetical protein